MAEDPNHRQAARTGMFIDLRKGGNDGTVTTKLGNVTVAARRPSADLVRENAARSSAALKRVSRLTQSGVFLPTKRGIPRYSVDENNPKLIIRRLHGQTTRGRNVDGHFVEL